MDNQPFPLTLFVLILIMSAVMLFTSQKFGINREETPISMILSMAISIIIATVILVVWFIKKTVELNLGILVQTFVFVVVGIIVHLPVTAITARILKSRLYLHS